jgi:hypothetical protein
MECIEKQTIKITKWSLLYFLLFFSLRIAFYGNNFSEKQELVITWIMYLSLVIFFLDWVLSHEFRKNYWNSPWVIIISLLSIFLYVYLSR